MKTVGLRELGSWNLAGKQDLLFFLYPQRLTMKQAWSVLNFQFYLSCSLIAHIFHPDQEEEQKDCFIFEQ